jgi:hypothetical protein
MNFFGHSVLAREERKTSEFLLGSMLPDFFGMTRVRPRVLPDGDLGRGIAHHLRVDDAFHGAPTFLELVAATSSTLEARGVRRGSARGVGHVGTELVLDAFLARDEAAVAAYRRALGVGVGALDLDDDARQRLDSLLARLRAHEGPADASPRTLTQRLEAAFAARPRLSLDARAVEIVEDELGDLMERVFERGHSLLDEVRQRMSAPRRASAGA